MNISQEYKKFRPALGFERPEGFVGRPAEEVVPNTLMRHVVLVERFLNGKT